MALAYFDRSVIAMAGNEIRNAQTDRCRRAAPGILAMNLATTTTALPWFEVLAALCSSVRPVRGAYAAVLASHEAGQYLTPAF